MRRTTSNDLKFLLFVFLYRIAFFVVTFFKKIYTYVVILTLVSQQKCMIRQELFQRYPGFKEVRTVPSRPDIAFVEYETVAQVSYSFILGGNGMMDVVLVVLRAFTHCVM